MSESFQNLFPQGGPNTVAGQYFSGASYLYPLSSEGGVSVANVTFEPACRNNWHIHHKGGQILLCTAGRGYYQEWGKPARELHPGDVVSIPRRSSTGTGPPRTAGLPMWLSLSPALRPSGWNPWRTRNIRN